MGRVGAGGRAPRAHAGRVRCLAVVGDLLCSGANDKLVKVWQRLPGGEQGAGGGEQGAGGGAQLRAALGGHEHWVRDLQALPEGFGLAGGEAYPVDKQRGDGDGGEGGREGGGGGEGEDDGGQGAGAAGGHGGLLLSCGHDLRLWQLAPRRDGGGLRCSCVATLPLGEARPPPRISPDLRPISRAGAS